MQSPKNSRPNSRPELSAFLSNFIFSNPIFIHADFLLTGKSKEYQRRFGCDFCLAALRFQIVPFYCDLKSLRLRFCDLGILAPVAKGENQGLTKNHCNKEKYMHTNIVNRPICYSNAQGGHPEKCSEGCSGGCSGKSGCSRKCSGGYLTILTEMMADEFNFLRPEIKNYKAEADADLFPIPGQLELHGRRRCGVLLSARFCALFVADLIVGMEKLELHYIRRGRSNLRKIKKATISVRMVAPVARGENQGLTKKHCNKENYMHTNILISFFIKVITPQSSHTGIVLELFLSKPTADIVVTVLNYIRIAEQKLFTN